MRGIVTGTRAVVGCGLIAALLVVAGIISTALGNLPGDPPGPTVLPLPAISVGQYPGAYDSSRTDDEPPILEHILGDYTASTRYTDRLTVEVDSAGVLTVTRPVAGLAVTMNAQYQVVITHTEVGNKVVGVLESGGIERAGHTFYPLSIVKGVVTDLWATCEGYARWTRGDGYSSQIHFLVTKFDPTWV